MEVKKARWRITEAHGGKFLCCAHKIAFGVHKAVVEISEGSAGKVLSLTMQGQAVKEEAFGNGLAIHG